MARADNLAEEFDLRGHAFCISQKNNYLYRDKPKTTSPHRMRKLFCLALCFLSFNALGQGILDRVRDPNAEKVVFVPKGTRTIGISGSYRSFDAGGDILGDGFSVMSLLNIGTGKIATYNVSPKFAYFLADDLSLGFRLDYSGYFVNTDLRLDLRSMVDLTEIAGDDPKNMEEIRDLFNLQVSHRHMVNNKWGASLALRKFIPFFGSQTVAIFAEARLFGSYAQIRSNPINVQGLPVTEMMRTSNVYAGGLKLAGGLCVRLRGGNALTVSVPLLGAEYSYTHQHQSQTNNNAHLSQFKVARNLDFLGVQVGYCHFGPVKNKKKK